MNHKDLKAFAVYVEDLEIENKRLKKGLLKLECLEAWGVSTWDGYTDAMEMYDDRN